MTLEMYHMQQSWSANHNKLGLWACEHLMLSQFASPAKYIHSTVTERNILDSTHNLTTAINTSKQHKLLGARLVSHSSAQGKTIAFYQVGVYLKRRGNPLLGDRIQMMDRINFSLGIASASITTVAARRKSKHVCMLSKAQNTSKKRLAQDHYSF